MICPDVNVLLYAFRRDSDMHEDYRDWLEGALKGSEPVGLSELVLSGVARIATHHRIYREPSSTDQVMSFCRALRVSPAGVSLRPGGRHFEIFDELCGATSAKGNDIPDAYHAALAIEHSATWITTDRGFARFPRLSWRQPFMPGV